MPHLCTPGDGINHLGSRRVRERVRVRVERALARDLDLEHLTGLLVGDREDGLEELFAGFEPFDFALTEVRRWPGVLWLAPEPAEPFVALTSALAARYPEHPPYEGEHDVVIPHLTVGHHEEVPPEVDA